MPRTQVLTPQLFRVWIAAYEGRRPRRWSDVPQGARAVEPADERFVTAAAAEQFLEGFNRGALRRQDRLWAVAVPVIVRVDGEPRRGMPLRIRRPATRRRNAPR